MIGLPHIHQGAPHAARGLEVGGRRAHGEGGVGGGGVDRCDHGRAF